MQRAIGRENKTLLLISTSESDYQAYASKNLMKRKATSNLCVRNGPAP
jgi:hypothetical protein